MAFSFLVYGHESLALNFGAVNHYASFSSALLHGMHTPFTRRKAFFGFGNHKANITTAILHTDLLLEEEYGRLKLILGLKMKQFIIPISKIDKMYDRYRYYGSDYEPLLIWIDFVVHFLSRTGKVHRLTCMYVQCDTYTYIVCVPVHYSISFKGRNHVQIPSKCKSLVLFLDQHFALFRMVHLVFL
jgi:hypothetical protein